MPSADDYSSTFDEKAVHGPAFGDDRTAEIFRAKCRRLRETQRVPFAVAPGSCVTTLDGRTLLPGDEVKRSDLPPGRLRELVLCDRVLEAFKPDDEPEPPRAA